MFAAYITAGFNSSPPPFFRFFFSPLAFFLRATSAKPKPKQIKPIDTNKCTCVEKKYGHSAAGAGRVFVCVLPYSSMRFFCPRVPTDRVPPSPCFRFGQVCSILLDLCAVKGRMGLAEEIASLMETHRIPKGDSSGNYLLYSVLCTLYSVLAFF